MKPSQLLSHKRSWCKGTYARTADGTSCSPFSPSAASWCLVGALKRCAETLATEGDWLARLAANLGHRETTSNPDELIGWSDYYTRTHAEILELLHKTGL